MSATPLVSVIVPVYNDPDGLKATLSSLVTQIYGRDDYEIVVVDNDSTDETPAVVESFANRCPDLLRPVREPTPGSYAARNTGIERSDGSIFVFLDADETVPETFLAAVVDRLRETGADYVGCAVAIDARNPESVAAKYNELTEFPVESYMTNHDFAPTCALVVRRSVVDAVGTFDESLVSSGDKEFGKRVADAGFEMHYADDIVVTHPARSAIELVRKHVRIGRGFAQMRRRHPSACSQRSLLDPRQYLPTLSPVQLRASASSVRALSDTSLSLLDLVGLYCLDYAVSLSVVAGRLYERVVAPD